MGKAPKSSFELAMERLRASDRNVGVEETKLSPAQKEKIAEARRVATSRFAEREILFRDAMQKTADPAGITIICDKNGWEGKNSAASFPSNREIRASRPGTRAGSRCCGCPGRTTRRASGPGSTSSADQ